MEGVMKKLALWHTRTFRPMMTHDDLEPLMISLGFVPVPAPPPPTTSPSHPAPPPSQPTSAPSPTPTPAPWREYAFSAAARRQAAHGHDDPAALLAAASSCSSSASASASSSPYSSSSFLPRPRLPCPRIDGLHILVYRAFIDAVAFYIGAHRVADHFHVRGMPLHRVHDRPYDKVFRMMSDDRRHTAPSAATSEDDGIFVFREGTLDQTTLALCTSNSIGNNSSSSITTTTTNNPINTAPAASAGSFFMVPLKDINVVIAV